MGCLNKMVKYTLFATNLLIFILGAAVLSLGIWTLVDKYSFDKITEKAMNECKGDTECKEGLKSLNKIASATYILIAISALIVIIAFFGCCGAYKENKCMLGTYFTIILALFIAMVVGTVMITQGDLGEKIKVSLKKELKMYDDTPEDNNAKAQASNTFWNLVQEELRCCGVDSFTDWTDNTDKDFHFNNNFNKPKGCCKKDREGKTLDPDGIEYNDCRKSADSQKYYFEGCYTLIEKQVKDNQNILVGVAIGVIIFMFLNMLFSFALCTMV